MKKILLIVLIVAVIIIAGFYSLNAYIYNEKQAQNNESPGNQNQAVDTLPTDRPNEAPTADRDGTQPIVDQAPDEDTPSQPVIDTPMLVAGSYEAYSPDKLARAAQGDVVLFFRATWCPTCRALDSDIKKNLISIPANTTILDVNYDTETSLKQKYGVTYQHTLVQVSADGTMIKKWNGGNNLSSVLTQIQ